MPTNYSLTYNGQTHHGPCSSAANRITFNLVADGKVQYNDGAVLHDVDLLTIYHTQDPASGQYPTPPETFTVTITYQMGFEIEPIYKHEDNNTATIDPPIESIGRYKFVVNGPTQDETTNFQLATDLGTPPHKLKIRVKRQPAFNCVTGPFDDVHGGEYS